MYIVLVAALVGVCLAQPTLPNENVAARSNTGFNLGSLVSGSTSDSAKSSFAPQPSSPASDPKESLMPFSANGGQQGPSSPAGIRTPFNRANQAAQSPLEPTEAASPQVPNRAGTFAQPLPGSSDLVPRAPQASGQIQRSPLPGDVEPSTPLAGQQPNKPNNAPPVWQPKPQQAEQSPSQIAASDSSLGSQRPLANGGLAASAKAAAADSAASGSASKPSADPIDRGQQPPPGGPLIVPRIISPQQAVGGAAPISDGVAGIRAGAQSQANAGAQAQTNANAESASPSPTFTANKPPAPTWQPAAPLNQRSPAQSQSAGGNVAPRPQEPTAGAQANIKEDGD